MCGLGCRGFHQGRRQYVHHRYGERMDGPTVSKTPDTQAHTLSGPGRSSYCPAVVQGREGKVATPKPEMYGMKKSDVGIVAMKTANKGDDAPAEQRERRPAREGKSGDSNMHRAQKWASVSQGIERLREFVKRNPEKRLTTLLHHVNVASLEAAFYVLKRRAAPGVDGVTWEEYYEGLEDRLADLHRRVHTGAYRATPSKRVEIPKPDGGTRPLGIAALEDKIVQTAVVECILAPIFESEFKDFSYGFRPKRSAHNALDALAYVIERRKVSYIVDADIRKFFDMVDQKWLVRFLEHRIADKRVIRLIIKWLKAGVMVDGQLVDSKVGTPQGAVISPILANIYLHYALDKWVHAWRKTHRSAGEVYIIRYADDFVVCFQYKGAAQRFMADLQTRLGRFGLSLHPKKTRLIEFGRFAEERRKKRGEGRPDTFDFLGFTHYCRKNRKGRFGVGRKPIAKRMSRFLRRVKEQLIRRRHRPVHETGKWLGQVLNGWLNYYAVPTSYIHLARCYRRLYWIWMRVLRRRSQRDRTTWETMDKLTARHWPKLQIRHPWPTTRFSVKHVGATQTRSHMR